MRGFVEFIREKGVVGLALAVVIGGSVTKLVTALVSDIVDPAIGLLLGFAKNLESASFKVGRAEFMWGHFLSAVIDFLIIAFIVYLGFRLLRLDRLDKPRESGKK